MDIHTCFVKVLQGKSYCNSFDSQVTNQGENICSVITIVPTTAQISIIIVAHPGAEQTTVADGIVTPTVAMP